MKSSIVHSNFNSEMSGDPVLYWMLSEGTFIKLLISLWKFSVLGINPSAEKSFNLFFFPSIDHWYNLMTLCLIRNDRHKENIFSFQLSLYFSFFTFPVLLAIWNYKFASKILYSRHFAFQCHCQSRISGHNFPGLLKSLPSLFHYF